MFLLLVIQPVRAQKDSNEVFSLYKQMEASFENSMKTIDAKNDLVMKSFSILIAQKSYLTQPWMDRASQARAISKAFNIYIKNLKSIFKTETSIKKNPNPENDGGLIEVTMIETRQDIDKNDILQNGNGGINSEGLQYHINKARESLIKLLDDVKIENVSKIISDIENTTTLRTDNNISYLENAPTSLVLSILTKYQSDCKNLESELLDLFLKQINVDGELDSKLGAMQVNVIPINGNLILEGELYEAKIILSNYSYSKNEVIINGSPVKVENGVGTYIQRASVGEHRFNGQMKIPTRKGEVKTINFNGGYTGLRAQASICAQKMNILYAGLRNPLKIEVPGYRVEDIMVTVTNGCTLTGTKGAYSLSVPEGTKEVLVAVFVKIGTESKPMGSMTFRVKNMPLPQATFGSKSSGSLSVEELNTIQYINCNLSSEFPFDGIKYTVKKFTISYSALNCKPIFFNIDGNKLTEEIKSILNTAKKGDIISLYNVEANSTDFGDVKIPSAVVLTVE